MPNESDLRTLLGDGEIGNRLDAAHIVAQSRRRRMPRQVGAALVGAMAIAGIAVVAVPSLQSQPPAALSTAESAEGFAADSGASDSSASIIKRAPAELLNPCAAPLTDVEPSRLGLVLEIAFADTAPVGTAPVSGVVRLTNTSDVAVSGTTAATPAITLSQDGVTLWHSQGVGDLSAVTVSLDPGESLEYPASFEPVRCAPEDDAAEQFRPALPALDPGSYDLSAALDFVADTAPAGDAVVELDLVTGPLSPVSLQ